MKGVRSSLSLQYIRQVSCTAICLSCLCQQSWVLTASCCAACKVNQEIAFLNRCCQPVIQQFSHHMLQCTKQLLIRG